MASSRDVSIMWSMMRGTSSRTIPHGVKMETRNHKPKQGQHTTVSSVEPVSHRRVAKVVDPSLDADQSRVSIKSSTAAFYQPDISYSGLTVVTSDDMWGGDPRDMTDEDLAFFGLER